MHRKISIVCTKRQNLLIIGVFIAIIMLVHFIVIPSASGSYNKACLLDSNSKESLEFLLRTIILSFEKHNVTYWLDYGTLLGAIRYNNIIPWDGDGDISFLKDDRNIQVALRDIQGKGIKANTMIASYRGMTVDFVRWTKKNKILHKYYPKFIKQNILINLYDKHDATPEDIIGQRMRVKFLNIQASIPLQFNKLLWRRYPLTYWLNIPYKWKCYIYGY